MTSRHRRWLIWALLASLLLHIVSIGGDTLLMLAGAWSRDEPLELRKPTKKLVSQDIDDEPAPTSLAGIKPAEKLTITFAHPQSPKPPAAPAVKPTQQSKVAGRKPVPTLASASATRGSGIASAVAASSVLVQQASAPQTASAVVASAQTPTPAPAPAVLPTEALPTQAASEIPKEKQFPRRVEIVYLWAVVPVKMTWEVEQGHYKLNLRGALFGRSRSITSEGKVGKNGVVPEHFTDYKDEKLLNEATFDWNTQQVQMSNDGKLSTDTLKPGDQDLFSAAFQFALQGSKMKNFTFSMVSGRKFYREVAFELRGESTLNLGGKQINALLLRGQYDDRVFDFWLAPDWNNMPVRIQLTLGKENTFDIWANQITINGEGVLVPLNQQTQRGNHRP